MPVTTTHKQYSQMADAWGKMRDVVAGEKTIHDKGEAYLPKLSGQDANEYDAYVKRASFYNATQRTVDGLSGMVFRKEPQAEVPESMREMLGDITLDGSGLQSFAESLLDELLVVSRGGILVDFPPSEGVETRAQADAENKRPFLRMYQAETITDWRSALVNNKTMLTQVRLHEVVEELSDKDEFDTVEKEQYRVLDLVTMDDAGNEVAPYYRQRIFQKVADKWEMIDEITPLMNGGPLDYIPFIFVGPRGTQKEVCKPVLLDLANANLSHYRTVADLEHGAHYTALPTPYVFGVSEEEAPTAIGPTELWHGQSGDVEVGLLEFTGQGLKALEERRDTKEQHMAALGARMLAPEKKQAEAAETMAIRHSGEMSVLASLAQALSRALTESLMIARDWLNLNGEVLVKLNTDFMPQPMTPDMLNALMNSWQGGGMAFDDLVWNLKQGEVIREERTTEDLQSEIQDETPAMPPETDAA